MARIKWSKERVIEEIRRIYGKLPCSHPDRKRLYEVAQRYFGSFDQALAAAGMERLSRKWSRVKTLEWIQQEYPQRGLAIFKDMGFLTSMYRYFGSRSAALKAAGFSAERLKWTPEIVLDRLRTHAQQYQSFEGLAQHDDRLYQAAKRHFGSWRQAIRAAGFAAPERWTKSAIIDAIQERQKRGEPLWNVSEHDPPLYLAAKRHLGNWRKALIAAGIEVNFPVKWTRERVHQGLLKLKNHPSSFTISQRSTLRSASLKYFESWAAALASVGLHSQPRQTWDADKVLWETRVWYYDTGGDRKRLPNPLCQVMMRYFGTMKNAFEAAGVPWQNGSGWSKPLIIQKIQDLHIEGWSIQQPSHVEESLARAAKNHFSSWRRALIASGLESVYLSYHSRLTRDAVIDVIQARHRQGQSLRGDDNKDLMTAVRKHFGSWVEAQVAAGLEPGHERWTRERLARTIRDRVQQGPIPFEDRIRSAAVRHFGGWREALIAAGVRQEA